MPMVTRRLRDPDVNPCLSESDASTRCMAENNYDKESCSSHFLKYKNCRKFWIVAVNLLGNAWFEMSEEHDIDVMTVLFVMKSKEEEGQGLGHLQREEALLDKKVDFVNLVC